VRTLTEVTPGILVRQSELFVTNSTVVTDGSRCLVVDPAVTVADVDELVIALRRADLTPVAGFASHPHWDHILWSTALGDVPRYASRNAVSTAERSRSELISSIEDAAPGHELEVCGQLTPMDPVATTVPWDGPDTLVVTHEGHAVGHCALFLPGSGTLLAGDMCSDAEVPLLDLAQADPVGDYLTGLERLAALPVQRVVPGHGSIGDAAEFRRRVAADVAYLDQLKRGVQPADPRLMEPWLIAEHRAQVSRCAELYQQLP
jgi:glyoxylase-like metal-dependent hydrolase (beta-lactamase superfamily II)